MRVTMRAYAELSVEELLFAVLVRDAFRQMQKAVPESTRQDAAAAEAEIARRQIEADALQDLRGKLGQRAVNAANGILMRSGEVSAGWTVNL